MKKGITLIEILVVIIIISFLAAVSLPVYHKARVKGVIVKTKTIISSLEAALSMYETDFGDYPAGTTSRILVELLQGPVENEKWNGPYIRFKKEDIDKNGNIIDGWKTPLIYKYPQSEKENVPYLIISAGPDKKFGTEDDFGNW